MSRDSRARSLVKTIIYRVWAIALLAAITYYFTGNIGEATTITVLFNAGGTLAYYGLERLFESVGWGKGASDPGHGHPSAWPGGPGHSASRSTTNAANRSIEDVEAA